jgi:Ca2+-binding RTX toxin-like protein
MSGTNGNDYMVDPGGDNGSFFFLEGKGGNDTLLGLGGDDFLDGGTGDDQLFGGNGNDYLAGGPGADRIDGGAGFDVAAYDEASSGVSIDLGFDRGDGTFGKVSGGDPGDEGDVFVSIEALIGSFYNDTLTGTAAANLLDGWAGDDLIDGRGGADTIDAADGQDTIHAYGGESIDLSADGSDLLIVSGGAAALNFRTGVMLIGGIATSIAYFHRVQATAGADSIVGSLSSPISAFGLAANDTLVGGNANDVLAGGAGADRLTFGAGIDHASYVGSSVGVLVDIRAGLSLFGDAAGDSWDDSPEGLIGGAGDDSLGGTDGANDLQGQDGNDYLAGYGGADTIAGGAGDDWIEDHDQAANAWTDSSTDILRGDAGADTILSAGGNDEIDGGADADLLILRLTGGAPVLATGGTSFSILVGGVSAARVNGIEALHLMTGAGADTLVGISGADTLDAGAGDDSVVGGGGDLLIGGEGFDILRLEGGAVLLDLLTGVAAVGGVALAGAFDFEQTFGSSGADTVRAGLEDFAFDGGEGADSIADGAGFDTLVGGAGNDTIRLSGQGDMAEGNAGRDLLVLDFGAPEDALMFVATNSRSWVVQLGRDDGAPVVAEVHGFESLDARGSAFNDTMNASVLTGASTLTGEAGNDLLTSGRGADLLMGGAGSDRLIGGAGADTLIGDAQADTLSGGAGADWFQMLDRADRNDRFRDFTSGQDLLVVSAAGWAGGLAEGMDLAATNRFVAGTVATERFGQFLYDQGAGILRYDSSGIGGAAPVVVATLTAGAAMTAADILVIA